MRRPWSLVAWVAVVSASLVLGACSREPASVKQLAAERALADSLVAGHSGTSPESLMTRVVAARAKVAAFMKRHQKDVPAALTFAKLRLAEAALTPPDTSLARLDHNARSIELKRRMDDVIPPLDRAIAAEPKNPEPHYWKSLVLGLWEPVFGETEIDAKSSRLPDAVKAASAAVALAPDSATYRTALATYQMLSGDDKAAVATLRAGKNPHDATLLLLSEWEKFPLPAGSVHSHKESSGIAEWLAMNGLDDAQARVRAHWFPGPADSVRAFYRRSMGDAFWMKQPPQKQGNETLTYTSAAILFRADGYHAVSEADVKSQMMNQAEGVSIQVREVRNPSDATRKLIPFDAGPVVCEILLTNHRRVR